MTALRVGVVGAGRWAAAHHIPALQAHPDATLVAVAEPDPERRRQVAERFGVACVVADVGSLLDAVTCDALVVASPPAAHHEAAAAALDRGIHVLVEKPLTIRSDDAWDLVARASAAQRTLMVGYPLELTSTASAVRETVAGGELGDIVLIDGVYASAMRHLFDERPPGPGGVEVEVGGRGTDDDPLARFRAETFNDPAVSGGGQSAGQLTHLLGAILGAVPRSPRAVSALMRPAGADVDLHDALLVDLGDVVATVASTCALPAGHPPMWEVRYVGDGGTLVFDLARGEATVRTGGGEPRAVTLRPGEEPYPAGRVVERFVDVVLGRAANPAPGELGARATSVIEAARASARDHGAPHPVPMPVSDPQ